MAQNNNTKPQLMSENSWAGLLQNRLRDRTELSWEPSQQEPIQYVTRYQVSREEREFDPVLQRFRDDGREDDFQRSEDSERTRQLNQSKIKNLSKTQSHDLINHQAAFPGVDALDEEEQRARQVNTRRGPIGQPFNIISNVDLAKHHHSHPSLRPEATGGIPAARIMSTEEEQAYARKRSSHPDFDLISNRYKQQHDAKTAADDHAVKSEALKKYWGTHDFDPVSCRFYQPDKEDRFQQRLGEVNRAHGKDFNRRLPPGILRSEGTNFDIISMKPRAHGIGQNRLHDEQRVPETTQGIKERMERVQQERAATQSALSETRNFNRHAARRHRHMHGYDNGYDIVSTQSFVGRQGAPKPNLRVREGATLWAQLEQQDLPHINNNNQDE